MQVRVGLVGRRAPLEPPRPSVLDLGEYPHRAPGREDLQSDPFEHLDPVRGGAVAVVEVGVEPP